MEKFYGDCTFMPKLKPQCPDFERLHLKEKLRSEAMKREFRGTRVRPFRFDERDQQAAEERERQANESEEFEVHKVKKHRARSSLVPPAERPKSTKKFDQMVQIQKERRRKREEEERRGTHDRGPSIMGDELLERMNALMVDNSSALQRKREMEIANAKELQREMTLEYKRSQQAMLKRVAQRPLLMESSGQDDLRRARARKRALTAVKESLQKAGITDFSRYFDKDELEDLGLD